MHVRAKRLLAPVVLGCASTLMAAPTSSTAVKDARQLVECMKAFDAQCVVDLTYERALIEAGLSRSQLVKMLSDSYASRKSKNIRYSRFDLGKPSEEFKSDGRTFVFIPYTQTIEIPGNGALSFEAYFIGVSEDQGATWTFVEGIKQTAATIRRIIPGYRNQPPLPPVSEKQE